MNRSLILIALFAGTIVAQAARAGEPVDQTLDAAGLADVSIEVRRGKAVVQGWDEPRVRVTGTRDDRSEAFVFERTGDSIAIEDRIPDSARDGDGTNFTVHVPRAVRVRASLVSADLKISDVDGRARLRTVSGDIAATGLGGDAALHTVSGDVEIDHAGAELRVDSVSGDIDARANARDLDVETVSGDASVDNRAVLQRGRVSTVSGDVDLATALAGDADLSLESVSGDVTLTLRGGVDARIDADAGPGGEIENALAGTVEREGRAGSGESLTIRIGSGSGDVQAATVSGTIVINAG